MATPSSADVATVRRRANEPSQSPYSDLVLTALIAAHPLEFDEEGAPVAWDLWAAAAEIWSEKAAALSSHFDFSADGASYSRSQAYENARKQASYCASRRAARGIEL